MKKAFSFLFIFIFAILTACSDETTSAPANQPMENPKLIMFYTDN